MDEYIFHTNDSQPRLRGKVYLYFEAALKYCLNKLENEEHAEDLDICIRNVFKEMNGYELQLACHKQLSHSVQKIVMHGNPKQIYKMFKALSEDFAALSVDACGSFVFQSLLLAAFNAIINTDKYAIKFPKTLAMLAKLILKYKKFVCINAETLLVNPSACKVINTLLQILSGCKVSDKRQYGHSDKAVIHHFFPDNPEVPEKFHRAVKNLIKRLINENTIKDAVFEPHKAVVIQTILTILSKLDPVAFKKFSCSLMSSLIGTENNFMDCISTTIPSHTMEKIITSSSSEQFSHFWTTYIKGNLQEIFSHDVRRHIGTTLIKSCPTKLLFQEIFEEIEGVFESISDHICTALKAMSESCVKLKCCQPKFVELLAKVLHCSEPGRKVTLVRLTVEWLFYEELENGLSQTIAAVNYYGSHIVQNMMKFQKPVAIVESLLNMEYAQIKTLFCDKIGSYVLDGFLTSETVGEKNRQRLVNKLQGNFVDLACHPIGTYCITALLDSVNIKAKVLIMEDLASNYERLAKNENGHRITKLAAVKWYQHKPDEWQKWHSQEKRKIDMQVVEQEQPKNVKRLKS